MQFFQIIFLKVGNPQILHQKIIDDYKKLILNYKKNFKLNKYEVDQAYKIFYYKLFKIKIKI